MKTPGYHQKKQGYGFGYAVFEDLPKIKTFQVNEVIVGDKETKNDPDLADTLQCIDNPLSAERIKQLQEQDPDIQKLKHKTEAQQDRQGILQDGR